MIELLKNVVILMIWNDNNVAVHDCLISCALSFDGECRGVCWSCCYADEAVQDSLSQVGV